MRRFRVVRQFRHGDDTAPAGSIVSLTASAARYLLLRGWIVPAAARDAGSSAGSPIEPDGAPAPPPGRRSGRRRRSG